MYSHIYEVMEKQDHQSDRRDLIHKLLSKDGTRYKTYQAINPDLSVHPHYTSTSCTPYIEDYGRFSIRIDVVRLRYGLVNPRPLMTPPQLKPELCRRKETSEAADSVVAGRETNSLLLPLHLATEDVITSCGFMTCRAVLHTCCTLHELLAWAFLIGYDGYLMFVTAT